MKIIKNIKRLLFVFQNWEALKLLILNYTDGYLYDTGWTRSAIESKPLDKIWPSFTMEFYPNN